MSTVAAAAALGSSGLAGATPLSVAATDEEAHLQEMIRLTQQAAEAFWSEQLPEAFPGVAYRPIVGWHPYEGLPLLAPEGCSVKKWSQNAFYCSGGHRIAYDLQWFRQLRSINFTLENDMAPVVILAHEVGHAIDWTVGGPANQSVRFELKADCLAGIFLSAVEGPNPYGLLLNPGDASEAALALAEIADPASTGWLDSTAHGDPDQRVQAFGLGYVAGANSATTCDWYDYATEPAPLTWNGWVDTVAVLPGTVTQTLSTGYQLTHPAIPNLTVDVRLQTNVVGPATSVIETRAMDAYGIAEADIVVPPSVNPVGYPIDSSSFGYRRTTNGQSVVGFVFLAVNTLKGAVMINAYVPETALAQTADDLVNFATATQFGWNYIMA